MPKMKTHRSAAKRFRRTATGKILRRRANISHLLTKKSSRRKRRLRRAGGVPAGDEARVRRMLRG